MIYGKEPFPSFERAVLSDASDTISPFDHEIQWPIVSAGIKATVENDSSPKKSRIELALRALARGALAGTAIGAVIGNAFTGYGVASIYASDTPLSEKMSEIATEISEAPVKVACENHILESLSSPFSKSDHGPDGAVFSFGLPYIEPAYTPRATAIRKENCETIVNYNPTAPPVESTDAYLAYEAQTMNFTSDLAILLHELEHIEGTHDEAVATCHAIQKLPITLRKLGIEPSLADKSSLNTAYRLMSWLPDEYLTDECYSDGPFDLGVSDFFLNREDLKKIG